MPEQQGAGRLYTLASLSAAQYDAWAMRSALIARQLATNSLPGNVAFTSGQNSQPLAFTQLGSYGATHGGFGLVKTSRRAWQVLQRAGMRVPSSATFPPEAHARAGTYARQIGFPVVVSSLTGVYRRPAADADAFDQAFAEVADRVKDQVLVAGSVTGQTLRFLIRGQQALAVAGPGRRDHQSLDDVDPSLKRLAITALEAIPGIDIASVTITAPQLQGAGAGQQALVERIMRSPHLRDFAAGSRDEALRLADLLVQCAAQDIGVRLAEPAPRVSLNLDFTGVPNPEAFVAELRTMVDAMARVDVGSGPETVADGAQLSITGRAHDAAMIITRAIAGFGAGSSAHMVQSRPAEL